jgi:hypothetical protein
VCGAFSHDPTLDGGVGRSKKAKSRNVDMHVCGESDGLIVPAKRANKADADALAAESAEGRRATKWGTHHKRTRAGPRAGDASHRGCGAYDKPYSTSGWPSHELEVRAV